MIWKILLITLIICSISRAETDPEEYNYPLFSWDRNLDQPLPTRYSVYLQRLNYDKEHGEQDEEEEHFSYVEQDKTIYFNTFEELRIFYPEIYFKYLIPNIERNSLHYLIYPAKSTLQLIFLDELKFNSKIEDEVKFLLYKLNSTDVKTRENAISILWQNKYYPYIINLDTRKLSPQQNIIIYRIIKNRLILTHEVIDKLKDDPGYLILGMINADNELRRILLWHFFKALNINKYHSEYEQRKVIWPS